MDQTSYKVLIVSFRDTPSVASKINPNDPDTIGAATVRQQF
jgi:hypothetical protein